MMRQLYIGTFGVVLGLAAAYAGPVAGTRLYPDIPIAEPEDNVMASPGDDAEMAAWTAQVFGIERGDSATNRVALHVVRQDHSVLHFGQSCIDTPFVIGDKHFEHGLGTHAASEIAVTIPKGAKSFYAEVGVDNNENTQGGKGSVEFSIEVDGHELFHSPVLKSGAAPLPVDFALPPDAKRMLLKVGATADGVSCDQADWADARFTLASGAELRLDENQVDVLLDAEALPFSFEYGGKRSREFLGNWKRSVKNDQRVDRKVETICWTDPATKLNVIAVVTSYTRYPAVDWVLYFENGGKHDTPIIENIEALDTTLRTGYYQRPLYLHELQGDACAESSFLPKTTAIDINAKIHRAPTGGRPSCATAFPWFDCEYGDKGIIAAVGWTGQWAADIQRAPTGPTRLSAGMEHTHFVLHPGETIRSPRIVLLAWQGDRQLAHNQFRRMVLYKYVPRINGEIARLPTALQTFDRYNARPGWATEAGQLNAVNVAKQLGCDTYWFDAAWFPGNFPNGVGNWFCKPQEFPNGLKPVGDACRANDMRFILWFEPERVAPGTQIAKEHSEFVLGGDKGGLYNLGDPKARKWLTDLLSKRIDEYGITFYRNDFNMDPLPFWQGNDAPDRVGMTEIQYVQGLYTMWDELRARHPGMLIDNCSSGGRRIDIEMCSRSVPLWRSDTNCSPGHPEWNQMHSMSLSQYVPLHNSCVWSPDRYSVRSSATGGLLCQFAYLDNGFPMDQAKAAVAETRQDEPYWYGDFYPLTGCTTAPSDFCAYQLHRSDLDAGVIVAFRRRECPYLGLVLGAHGVRQDGQYAVEFVDEKGATTNQTLSGKDLATNLTLRIPETEASMIVRYKPVH